MMSGSRWRIGTALALAALVAAGVACGDDDDDNGGTSNNAAQNNANNQSNNANNQSNNANNQSNNANNQSNNANNSGTCGSNADCFAANGAGSLCMDTGMCSSALSTECQAAGGAWDADNLVVIGSILPTSGDYASIGLPIEGAVQMAVDEFNENGGVGGDIKLAHLGCDDAGNSEQGQRAAQHLADIGSPAIIGPAFSGIYINVVTLVTKDSGVMTMSPSATSPAITGLDDGGLAWRTVPSDAYQGVAMAARVRDIQTERGGTPLKVIAFGKDDAYGQGLLGAVTDELAAELGDDFFGTIYENPGEVVNPNIPDKVAQALVEIPQPDIVLLLGTNEVFTVLDLIEADVDAGNLTRPLYIVSDGGKLPEAVTAVMNKPELGASMEIITPAGENGAIYTGYNDRFNARFGADAGVYSANAYDAAYLIGFGLCKVLGEGGEATGGNIASAMGNLITGVSTQARPSSISSACASLQTGGSIDFDGASGPLNFDLTTGEAPGDGTLFDVWERRPGEFEFRTVGSFTSSNGDWAYSER